MFKHTRRYSRGTMKRCFVSDKKKGWPPSSEIISLYAVYMSKKKDKQIDMQRSQVFFWTTSSHDESYMISMCKFLQKFQVQHTWIQQLGTKSAGLTWFRFDSIYIYINCHYVFIYLSGINSTQKTPTTLQPTGPRHSRSRRYSEQLHEAPFGFETPNLRFLLPRKWTNVPWKGSIYRRTNLIFQPSIFRGYNRGRVSITPLGYKGWRHLTHKTDYEKMTNKQK